ncbi:MAG: hypothetical protein JOZ54_10175 [Acidobacteria bacterium]|nr:hypothetical protein [Acidobacteriota bacterium]
MKKMIAFAALALLVALPTFATYNVVLKNGTQYVAQSKWTVNGAKARFRVAATNQLIEVNVSEIDEPKSEQMTKLGLGDAKLIDLQPNLPSTSTSQQNKASLGSQIHLKKQESSAPRSDSPTAPAYTGPMIPDEVLQRFARAYENVGIFEQKLTPTGLNSFRVELTADSEDKVFNAISATSFLVVRNAGVANVQVNMVELFMKTTTGGSSGRFQMTREDAAALDAKTMSLPDYFVRKVLY